MKRTLLVFAGRSKSGKSTLAKRLCKDQDLAISTFSDVVRRVASERRPGAEQTIQLLQDIGAELVSKDPGGFCRDVCRSQSFPKMGCVVLDGLRHKSLLPHLRALHPGLRVVVVYVEAGLDKRRARFAPPLDLEDMERIDNHPVEQEQDALRESADLILTTDCPEKESYERLYAWLSKQRLCFHKPGKESEPQVTRALARIWIVLSIVWIAFATFYVHSSKGLAWMSAKDATRATAYQLSDGELIPLKCAGIRGVEASDFFNYKGHCWMSLATFRNLYPEMSKEDTSSIIEKTYRSASLEKSRSSALADFGHYLRAALFVPVVILLTGLGCYWAIRGLRASSLWGL